MFTHLGTAKCPVRQARHLPDNAGLTSNGELGKYCEGGRRRESGWERLIRKYLTNRHIRHGHQPFKVPFALDERKTLTYKPDITAGNVIIEPTR